MVRHTDAAIESLMGVTEYQIRTQDTSLQVEACFLPRQLR
jgi:hypothetical protein